MNWYKETVTAVMCLSFVTGTYEIVVEESDYHPVYYTGGGLMCYRYDVRNRWNEMHSEDYVRSLLSDEQWDELMKNEIIECKIERE